MTREFANKLDDVLDDLRAFARGYEQGDQKRAACAAESLVISIRECQTVLQNEPVTVGPFVNNS